MSDSKKRKAEKNYESGTATTFKWQKSCINEFVRRYPEPKPKITEYDNTGNCYYCGKKAPEKHWPHPASDCKLRKADNQKRSKAGWPLLGPNARAEGYPFIALHEKGKFITKPPAKKKEKKPVATNALMDLKIDGPTSSSDMAKVEKIMLNENIKAVAKSPSKIL